MYDMFVFCGHGQGDNGASGNGYVEFERVSLLTRKVVELLKDKGINVFTNLDTGLNNYNNNLTKGRIFKYNMGCELHLNSVGDNNVRGSEIIVPNNEKYLTIENSILEGYKSLGFNIRGIKSRDYESENFSYRENGKALPFKDWYKVIRESWNNNISLSIIETCFISNKEDITLFNNNIDKISKIIANGYLKEMDKPLYILDEITQPVVNNSESKMYRVITGSFKEKSNAEKRLQELKIKGFESFIE